MKNISFIATSHSLARELLSKPDGFLIASDGEREYIIDNYTKEKTHANIDDYVMNWVLVLKHGGDGNVKK